MKPPNVRSFRSLSICLLGIGLFHLSFVAAQQGSGQRERQEATGKLSTAVKALDKDLATNRDGARHKESLQLVELQRLAARPLASLDHASAEKMQNILKTFDSFSQDRATRMVASRPSFQELHRVLKSEVATLSAMKTVRDKSEQGKDKAGDKRGPGSALVASKMQTRLTKLPPGRTAKLSGATTAPPEGVRLQTIKDVENPELKVIVDRVVATAKLSMHKAVANLADSQRYPLPSDPKAFENIFAAQLQTLPEAKRRTAIAKVMPLIQGSKAELQKQFGDLSTVNLGSTESVAQQAQVMQLRGRPIRIQPQPGPSKPKGQVPHVNIVRPVPLYRYYNTTFGKHMYSHDFAELGVGRLDWNFEGIAAMVYNKQVAGTVPLYRYTNGYYGEGAGDHFYQLTRDDEALKKYGYKYEMIAGYVWANPGSGLVPLHRYWSDDQQDHFYTVVRDDAGLAAKGYGYEQVACYVMPHEASTLPPMKEANTIEFKVGAVICGKKIKINSDDFYLGGVVVGPTGTTSPLETFAVDTFTSRTDKYYPNGRTWVGFDLLEDNFWPKSFTITMVPGVKGSGGDYNEFLNKLVGAISQEVKKYLGKAVGTAAGASAGGPLGALIGLAVGAAVDEICKWLVIQYFDNIFQPVTVQFTLNGPMVPGGDDFFGGTAHWTQSGGEYGMVFFMRVYKK